MPLAASCSLLHLGLSARTARRWRAHWQQNQSRRSRAPAAPLASQATLMEEWDIVAYSTPAGVALGRVSQVGPSELHVERLEHDATNRVWLVSHGDEEHVPRAAVLRTVEADYLQLVDPDRCSNPHGEHALEAYRITEGDDRAGGDAGAAV